MTTDVASRASTPSRTDLREAHRLATREKLLESSITAFQRDGFARTEVATIVEQAGVSRGTFYFHFPTKDDVLAELRMREEQRIAQEVSPRLANGEPLASILRAIVSGILQAEERLGVDLVREICAVQFRPSVVDSDSPSSHPVAELVLAAVASSSKRARKPDAAQEKADLAIIFLVGLFGLLSTHNPSEDRDRVLDGLIDLTVKGVATR